MTTVAGIVVKCHQTRWIDENRKLARELLVAKLDDLVNGEMSVQNQIKRYQQSKFTKNEQKKKKLRELKSKWLENEGLK